MTNHNNAVGTPAVDVDAIFTALETWINRRPGLEYANYGAMAPYRAELRAIANDKRRALKALDEARGLQPARPELLADAFNAFSGRLEWIPAGTLACNGEPQPAHLEYTTGQYWPTEYRKAAAAVLERYISLWRQSQNETAPKTFTYQTMADVKAANQAIGNHWFDRGSIRFFNTRVESGLIGGKYFITSERMDETRPRRYSVRCAEPDGSVNTVGEFQQYLSKEDARDAIRALQASK